MQFSHCKCLLRVAPIDAIFFWQMRAASWSIFKAMPTITTLGITALNGLTVVHARGNQNEVEGYQGSFVVYANSTNDSPQYYKEFVDEITGDPITSPIVEDLRSPLHTRQWFIDALTVPVNSFSWFIERSYVSKFSLVLLICHKIASS